MTTVCLSPGCQRAVGEATLTRRPCRPRPVLLLAVIAGLVLAGQFAPRAEATLVATNLHSFQGADGSHPRATLALGSDGNLYGTTLQGGASNVGTIFRLTPQGALTTLHSFAVSDGAGAYGLTLGSDGNFYGTTSGGGSSTTGTVFRISSTGSFASLHSFNGADGAVPFAPLVEGSNGLFYGTTYFGGLSNRGTIFQIKPDGTFTSLHSFVLTDGQNPYGQLVQGPDGNLYGTTHGGGTNALGVGTVFRISPGGGFTNIYYFHTTDGSAPYGGLALGPGGNFYGTTFAGGTNNGVDGTVFRLTPGGTLTQLHSFVSGEGYSPQAGLFLASDGNFYGTTTAGGAANLGTIFRISIDGSLSIMHSFLTNDGIGPYGGVIQGTDGSFYCSTYSGGASNLGSVFKLSLSFCTNTAGPGACSCPTLTTLHTFSGGDGSALDSELVLGPDGSFYGTTLQGGTSDRGTIFRVGADGSFSNLYKFAGFPADGQNPYGGLVLGNDGNLYGAATSGGSNAVGSFFRITPGGSLVNLHDFVANTDGGSPESSLILGKDGNFYGTCTGGGLGKRGTVFQVTPSGTLTVLHAFSGPDGDLPFGGLVQGTNGDFYGTTHSGGLARTGSVFRVSSTGVFSNLHSFNYVDGRWPQSALVEGSDGNFYGTTVGGGTNTVCLGGCGTVFRISPDGTFTSLYSFDGNQSSSPFGALLLGKDGNFYGTTDGGGDFGVGGTVFQITPSGTLTTLYSFTGGGDGRGPLARLIQGSDGALYGTTAIGGSTANCSLGCGTVFRLCLPQVVSANPSASIQFVGASPVLTISTVAGQTYQLQTRDSLVSGNWTNIGSPISGMGGPLSTTNSARPLPPQRFYRFLITP